MVERLNVNQLVAGSIPALAYFKPVEADIKGKQSSAIDGCEMKCHKQATSPHSVGAIPTAGNVLRNVW